MRFVGYVLSVHLLFIFETRLTIFDKRKKNKYQITNRFDEALSEVFDMAFGQRNETKTNAKKKVAVKVGHPLKSNYAHL